MNIPTASRCTPCAAGLSPRERRRASSLKAPRVLEAARWIPECLEKVMIRGIVDMR